MNDNNKTITEILNKEIYSNKFPQNIDLIYDFIAKKIKENKYGDRSEIINFLNNKIEIIIKNLTSFTYSSPTLLSYIKLYEPCINNKDKKKSWDKLSIYLFDQCIQGRDFLAKYNIDLANVKEVSYRKYALETSVKKVFEKSSEFLEYSPEIYDKKLKEAFELISRYHNSSQPMWEELLKKYPSIPLAYIASELDYELKPLEIKNLFDTCIHQYQKDCHKNIQPSAEILGELIHNAPFFEKVLAPAKKIELAVSKFLEYPINNENSSKSDIFAKTIIKTPIFKVSNLEIRIEKSKSFKIFGTRYPTNEQKEMIKNMAIKPTTKKVKI